MLEGISTARESWKVPAESFTTLLVPHPSSALWMAGASSPPLGETVVQMGQEPLGTPPTEFSPGFHSVRRSGGTMRFVVTVTEAKPFRVGLATLVATT